MSGLMDWIRRLLGIYDTDVKSHRASFLLQNVKYCTLAYLSEAWDDNTRNMVLDMCKKNGDTVFYIMCHSENPAENINPYVGGWDAFGSQIDEGKMKRWEKRIQKIFDKGLVPVIWLYCDDFGKVKRLPKERRDRFVDDMVGRWDKYANCWVIGIEEDETMGLQIAKETAQRIRARTKKPIGSHQLDGRSDYACQIPEVGVHFHQYKLNLSNSQMEEETRRHKANVCGKKFVAAEYNRDSLSLQAHGQGMAAVVAGADGTGNGR